MTTTNLIAGLQILQKYGKKHDYHVAADHEIIYFSCRYGTQPSLEDMQKLWELGWSAEDDEIERDRNNVKGNADLDPNANYELWHAYV